MKKLTTDNLNVITDKIIKCAIEVHKNLGPGLLESIYEKAMCYELSTEDINFSNQVIIPITYKGTSLRAQTRLSR
jgi:GxxExxY protein